MTARTQFSIQIFNIFYYSCAASAMLLRRQSMYDASSTAARRQSLPLPVVDEKMIGPKKSLKSKKLPPKNPPAKSCRLIIVPVDVKKERKAQYRREKRESQSDAMKTKPPAKEKEKKKKGVHPSIRFTIKLPSRRGKDMCKCKKLYEDNIVTKKKRGRKKKIVPIIPTKVIIGIY